MLFNDKIIEIGEILSKEINRLLELAFKKQKHSGNLLLLSQNGLFKEEILEYNKISPEKLSPYVIGPDATYYAEQDHFLFIDKYRTNISNLSYEEYQEQLKYSQEKSTQIDEMIELEKSTIHFEALIYLKIWETDLFIKRLYQFVRILNGEDYDWNFKINESSRDNKHSGPRQEIIRIKIRDRLKVISPILYNLIKSTYITQIRNSIAHSNFSFSGQYIHLNNYIENDKNSHLKSLTFEEWANIFHNTLIFHSEYIGLINTINDRYCEKARLNNNIIPVMITKKNGMQNELLLEYKPDSEVWVYK